MIESKTGVTKCVLTGVGFGPSILPLKYQAEYLERITFKSMISQSKPCLMEWIIVADARLSEKDSLIVDKVAVNSGARLIWANREVATWGEVLMSKFIWDEDCPTSLLTIGLPSGGALNSKYIETVDGIMDARGSGWLSYNGGVVRDKKGNHGYTKNRYNYFSSRKEPFGSGVVPLTCFLDEENHDRSRTAPQHILKDSKSAWMIVADGNVAGQEKVDLSQFGLENN